MRRTPANYLAGVLIYNGKLKSNMLEGIDKGSCVITHSKVVFLNTLSDA